MSRRLLTGLAVAFVLGLVAVGVYVRTVPANERVFAEDEPRLLGGDAYYHLRHTRFAAAHFPDLLRYDIGTHYPQGQRAFTPGLYDLAMAAGAWVLAGGEPDEIAVRTAMAWTPVVLGAAALLLLVVLGRRALDWPTGLFALLIATLYPAGFLPRTTLGFADHHAAEIVLLLWILWGWLGVLREPPTGLSRRRQWTAALRQSLPLALVAFTWRGAPLYIAMLGLALMTTLVLEVAAGRLDRVLVARLRRYAAAAFGLTLAPALLFPVLVMDTYLFPMLLLGLALLGLVPTAYELAVRALRARGGSNRVIVLGTLLLTVTLIFLAQAVIPEARRALRFLTSERIPWVREHVVVDPERFWSYLGLPGVLALASPILVVALTRRDAARLHQRALVVFATLMLLLWYRVHDYEYVMPALSALAAALTARLLIERFGAEHPRRQLAAALAALLLVTLPVFPLRAHVAPYASRESVQGLVVLTDGWRDALVWLEAHTPEPSLPVDAKVEPFEDFHYPPDTYGVFNAWDYGNFVAALGRRHTTISQEVSERSSQWLLVDDEPRSIAFWSEFTDPGERVRYVIIDADTMTDHFAGMAGKAGVAASQYVTLRGEPPLPYYGDDFDRLVSARLYFDAGEDLSHYRLVYQSPERNFLYYRAQRTGQDADGGPRFRMRLRSEPLDLPDLAERYDELREHGLLSTDDGLVYLPRLRPTVRIFEVVRGATLSGSATPGSTVEAQLPLRSGSDGAESTYRRTVAVGANGRFQLTLPYTTDASELSDLVATDLYRIFLVGGRHAEPTLVVRIGVPERFVLAGETLDLGDLERGRQ